MQPNRDFTAKGEFHRGFVAHFAAAENFTGRGLWLRNLALEGVVAHFTVVKWAFGLRNGTRVPKGGFARGGLWLRNCFAGGPSFRSITPIS